MTKLGLHFQASIPGWAYTFYEKSGSAWGKVMDIGDSEPMPEMPQIRWIIRFSEDEKIAKSEVEQGAAGAQLRLNRLRPKLEKRPWLSKPRYYLEHMNEPSNAGLLSTKWQRLALDEFTAAYTRLLWNEFGIRSVGYCLGVGHPEIHHVEELFSKGFPALVECEGLWSVHEYGWPSMTNGEGYYCFRYRSVAHRAMECLIPLPPLAITECGIDKLIVGEVGGWQKVDNNGEWYVYDELGWYDAGLMQNDFVLCATPFTSTPYEPWLSGGYEVRESDAEILAEYMSGSG